MNKKLMSPMVAVIFSFFSVAAMAQKAPKWLSDKGYWVVESNIHTPLAYTISYYTNDNVLINKKSIIGVKLNLQKRKVKMQLKKDLEAYVTAWERQTSPGKDQAWISDKLQ
jgi:hypothetical protein